MPRPGVIQRRGGRLPLAAAALALALVFAPRLAAANGADLPPQIVLEGFLKPENGRLALLVRIPLALLAGFGFPKRGPGYLDLARLDDRLGEVTRATARQIELFEDGRRLVPTRSRARIALLSDRSFQSYGGARAHFEAATLPIETDLYWNQGFLDAELEYPITSAHARFSVRVNMAAQLAERITLHLEFLPTGRPPRIYDLPGTSRRVPLDPRWYEAVWTFARTGFSRPFAIDRLVFLLCLVAPFRRFWSLLAIVMALTGLQAASLTASAFGATPDWRLFGALFETCLAASVVLLAIENMVAPSLRRRWLLASVVGVLSGFDFGRLLVADWQFAGAHAVASAVSLNFGIALGQVVSLALAAIVLDILFRYVTGKRLGVVILSLVLGHVGWHWMVDGGHRLEHAAGAVVSTATLAAVAWWLLLGLLVGGAAWFLPDRFDGRSEDNQPPGGKAIATRASP